MKEQLQEIIDFVNNREKEVIVLHPETVALRTLAAVCLLQQSLIEINKKRIDYHKEFLKANLTNGL